MKKNINIFSSISINFISSFFVLISGFISSFLLPITFSINSYGFLKLFSFYVGFYGIFHLGSIDGIYLKYGGRLFPKENLTEFKKFINIYFQIHLLFGFLILLFGLFFFDNERRLIIIFSSVNLLFSNFIFLFSYITSISGDFSSHAYRNIFLSISNVLFILLLFFLKIDNFIIFILFQIFINFIVFISYIYQFRRSISFGSFNFFDSFKVFLNYSKIGFQLLMANFLFLILYSLPRIFIDIFNNQIGNFAIYSFSYNLINIVNLFVVSVSSVFYPYFKINLDKLTNETLLKTTKLINVVLIFGSSLFFPLKLVVNNFIQNYNSSIDVLLFLIPIQSIVSIIQIVKFNYYKVSMNLSKFLVYLIMLFVLNISLNFTLIIYSSDSILFVLVSLLIFSIFNLLTDLDVYKNNSYTIIENSLYLIISFIVLFHFHYSFSLIKAWIYYFLFVSIVTIIYNRKLIHQYLTKKLKYEANKIQK